MRQKSAWNQKVTWKTLVFLVICFVATFVVLVVADRSKVKKEQPVAASQPQGVEQEDWVELADAKPSTTGDSKPDVAVQPRPAPASESSRKDAAFKSARKAMKLGRALYDKGHYEEAKEVFEFAADIAPELNDPSKWIAACDTQLRISSGKSHYVDPKVLAESREAAQATGGWAAGTGEVGARGGRVTTTQSMGVIETHPAQRRFYRLIDDPTAAPGEIGNAMLDALDEIDREWEQDMREWR